MRISKIYVGLALSVQPKQYESLKASAGTEVELAEGDDPRVAFEMAKKATDDNLKTNMREAMRKYYDKED